MKVYNCKVVDNDDDTPFGITGVRQAGGLCGNFQSDQSYVTAENARAMIMIAQRIMFTDTILMAVK